MKQCSLQAKLVVLGAAFLGQAVAQSAVQPAVPAAQTAPKPAQNVRVSLTQDLIRSVVVDGKGKEERLPAPATVLPGAVLLEEVAVSNLTANTYSGLTVRVPVPKGTQFFGAATPSGARWKTEYSADGGKTFSPAPQRRVITGGQSVQVEIKPSEYTNVRWVISSLKADETLKLSFRVKVN